MEELADSRLCGSALAFDRLAKSFAPNFNAYSSSWTSDSSCSLLFKFVTNLLKAIRNSDTGVRIVFVHRHSSDFNSVLTVQATSWNFQYGSNFGVPLDSSSWLWCFFVSWQCTHDRPLHGIVRNLQCLSSWNTVWFQQHSGILHPYKICSICLVIAFQFVLRIFAIESLCEHDITIQRHFCLDHAWHEWGTRLPSDNGSLRSYMASFVVFTHFCDCSVKTELIYRSNKQFESSPYRHNSESTIFHVLCFWADLWTMDLSHGTLDIHVLRIPTTSSLLFCPIPLLDYLHW